MTTHLVYEKYKAAYISRKRKTTTVGTETKTMDFTPAQVDRAMAIVKRNHPPQGFHFAIARDSYHQETLDVFQQVFWADEPICNSLGLAWSQEVANFHMKLIQDNLTLIAVNDDNGEIMGIRIISTSKKEDQNNPQSFHDEKVQKLFKLLNHVSNKGDVFNHLGVTRAFDFIALAVRRKYRKCGLGTKLMAAAVDLVKNLEPDSACITGLGTSRYSQAIFERLGFENMYELMYKDYVIDGKKVISNNGEHEKIVCYAMKI